MLSKFNFLYNLRIYGLKSYTGKSILYKHFLNTFTLNQPSLSTSIDLQEYFDFKEKSLFLSSNLLSQDFAELSTTDNFKEYYPMTSSYSKALNLIKNKENLKITNEIIRKEVENCLVEIEKYAKSYETAMLLSSFLLDISNFNQRLYVLPKKPSYKTLIVKNFYDTKANFDEEYRILIENYKMIMISLEEYPMWKEKFDLEAKKLFSYSNILNDFEGVYDIVQKQKIFK